MQAYWSWIGEEHFQMSFFFQRAEGGGLKPAQWSADCCLIDLIVCFPPALPAHRPMTGFWLLPLHACRSNPPRTTAPPQSQHQLNLTVLNEWNNTELTSRENPPHYHFPQSLLYYSVYWPAEGCDGSVQIYAKKKKKSPHCSPMTVSLTIHYGWIPEDSLSFWATVHAETLKCWCCVFKCSFRKA